MGDLVGRHYPTSLALKAADHTYVECGTGKRGWSCWGGKEGGDELRRSAGSTIRANAIAGRDERAGVTCYLVNGVCHQAANRILLPAGITMDGVRGYKLSVAIFTVYGRPRGYFGRCNAPFEQHEEAAGDLPECLQPNAEPKPSENSDAIVDYKDRFYMDRVRSLYISAEKSNGGEDGLFDFAMMSFDLLVHLTLGRDLGTTKRNDLRSARSEFEEYRIEAEQRYADTGNLSAFADEFDRKTLELQEKFSEVLDEREYSRLLDLPRGDLIVISNPDILPPKPKSPASNARFQP